MNSQIRESQSETETPTQRLASILLGESVTTYIGKQRETGQSWRRIADSLRTATDGQIDVTYETLRSWANGSAA